VSASNAEWFARAQRTLPGGVNSPVRSFRSVGGTPYFVVRAEGPYVWDVEGRQYVDYVQSYGASILGHANPAVVAAIRAAAGDGTSYGAPTPREVELAETIAAAVPGVEQVRLVSSGTEAAMSAIRLARGATGRATLVKFAGCYHGHADALLAAGGSGVANQGLFPTPLWPTPSWRRSMSCPASTTRWRWWPWSRSPPTWDWSHPSRGSSKACAPNATGWARCCSSTR
jgi:glutamate-1-semialdehyde 2,1-aminomutase